MSKNQIDLAQITGYARALLTFEGTLAAGVDAFGNESNVQSVNDATTGASRLRVEPSYWSRVGPIAAPMLDGLTRMIVYPSVYKSGSTVIATNINLTVQWSRDETNWVDFPTALMELASNDVELRASVHVVDNLWPANFMQDSAAAGDEDDYLFARLKINSSTATSGGSIIIAAMVLLLPGATPSALKKPRGAVFSTPNVDY